MTTRRLIRFSLDQSPGRWDHADRKDYEGFAAAQGVSQGSPQRASTTQRAEHHLSPSNRQGKIKHIGLSEVSASTLQRAVQITHVDAVQLEYSPFSLECEQDNDARFGVRKVCRDLGIALVAYSPLGQ